MKRELQIKQKVVSPPYRPRYRNITRIDCHGDKCRLHADDGNGIHCTACFGDLDELSDDGF